MCTHNSYAIILRSTYKSAYTNPCEKPQVELILTRAIDSLAANGVTPDRDMWLKQAEEVRSPRGVLGSMG